MLMGVFVMLLQKTSPEVGSGLVFPFLWSGGWGEGGRLYLMSRGEIFLSPTFRFIRNGQVDIAGLDEGVKIPA